MINFQLLTYQRLDLKIGTCASSRYLAFGNLPLTFVFDGTEDTATTAYP